MTRTGNNDKYYAWEKFGSAVRVLAMSEAPMPERVQEAQGCFFMISEADMPNEDAAKDYRSLMTRMTSATPKGDEGTIAATMAVTSAAEARALAGLIVDIEDSLARAIIEAARKGEKWGEHH